MEEVVDKCGTRNESEATNLSSKSAENIKKESSLKVEKLNRLKKIQSQRKQLQDWIKCVNGRVFELETAYLEETANGNIVKGWDLDGRLPLKKGSGIDEKDRLFSNSSYTYMTSKRQHSDLYFGNDSKQTSHSRNNSNLPKNLKKNNKKRKSSEYEDWNGLDDY
jgi:chromatin modification-related protein EAF6